MQWDAFLESARRLAAGTTEGDWRSAASRAYYAVYSYFIDWLAGRNIRPGRHGAHAILYWGLVESREQAVKDLAARVNTMRVEREVADYDLRTPFRQQRASAAIREAERIVQTFQQLLITIAADDIVADFQTYLNRRRGQPPTP